jgi:hypothetical protein
MECNKGYKSNKLQASTGVDTAFGKEAGSTTGGFNFDVQA